MRLHPPLRFVPFTSHCAVYGGTFALIYLGLIESFLLHKTLQLTLGFVSALEHVVSLASWLWVTSALWLLGHRHTKQNHNSWFHTDLGLFTVFLPFHFTAVSIFHCNFLSPNPLTGNWKISVQSLVLSYC